MEELKIYYYRKKGVLDRLKIGQTTQDVEKRFRQQILTSQCGSISDYELLFGEPVLKPNGEYLTDHEIHKRLDEKGFVNPGGGADWRICTEDDVQGVINAFRYGNPAYETRPLDFKLRPEQHLAVHQTAQYFRAYNQDELKNETPKFLWNAKMRFGKCFTTYHLAKEMGWSKLLVLTFKPVVSESWRNDLERHIDFSDWGFSTSEKSFRDNIENNLKSVVFYSFQDLLGSGRKVLKKKHQWLLKEEWDCLILDEYHFGARGALAKEFYETGFEKDKFKTETVDNFTNNLIKKHLLCLSGTPFKSIQSGEFDVSQIFNWTYLDEQSAKENWNDELGTNPYEELPQMNIHLYSPSEELQNLAKQSSSSSFDLNWFFSTNKQQVFENKENVERFLKNLSNGLTPQNLNIVNESFCLSDLRPNHMIWLFSNVDSCYAMQKLLTECQFNYFSGFKPILVAGDTGGSGQAALSYLKKEMHGHLKTITLTCGKLMTGTTVADWDTILLFTNLKAPETYFQSIFRVQSPFSQAFKYKKVCHVVDFNPNRSLIHFSNYFLRNIKDEKSQNTDLVFNFSKFLPIFRYDEFTRKPIDFNELQEFFYSNVTDEILIAGWENTSLLNVGYASLAQTDVSINGTISKLPTFKAKPSSKGKVVSDTPGIDGGSNPTTPGGGGNPDFNVLKEKDIIEKLKFLISRIYFFFYLYNEYIEGDKGISLSLREILNDEDFDDNLLDLFEKVTTLSICEFKELSKSNLINIDRLSLCIEKINHKIKDNSQNRDDLCIKK